MSSSVFIEAPSARRAADGDSNLVVVYSKNGISFDERAMESLMEEKSITTISVVRITSPTPSMVDQEEAERLKELEQFLDAATDTELDSDNGSQSGGDDVRSEVDHNPHDDDNNTDDEVNDDSTETETEAPKTRKRPGRKPKVVKKKKRRKPKERPQIVGLRVEQFYGEGTADLVVKNALKLAGLSLFKRTPETDALMEVIKNDHNYTPFTSPEQMKLHKRDEKIATEKQSQSRKIIMQASGNVKLINAKKRIQAMPFTPLQAKVQRLPVQPQQEQLLRKHQPQPTPTLPPPPPLPRERREMVPNARPRSGRGLIKVIASVDDHIDDDEEADSSDPADDENADKLYDSDEMSEESDDLQDTDNDRDSDMDFKMRHDSRSSNKRKRARKISSRPTRQSKPLPSHPPTPQQFPELKRRKEQVLQRRELLAQISPQRRELVPQSAPQRREQISQSASQRREPVPQTAPQRRELMQPTGLQRRELVPLRKELVLQRKEPLPQTAPQRKEPLLQTAPQRKEQMQPTAPQRKEHVPQNAPQIGQIIQLPTTRAPPTVIALGRGIPSTSFLKIRPTHQALNIRKPPMSTEALGLASTGGKVRRTPLVQVGKVLDTSAPCGFSTPPPQDVKEIIINKNTSSPKGVFTNLNSLLGENHTANIKSSPDPHRQRPAMSPITPRSSFAPSLQPAPVPITAKGFMPIGVDTAQSHKLPSQIVIETHQSSSELAAENDKQLDLIDSIVKDELLKTTLVEQPAVVNADENIPKLVKMLESTASVLDQGPVAAAVAASVSMPAVKQNDIFAAFGHPVVIESSVSNAVPVDVNDGLDLDTARLLNTPDEDEITADFLQHVVGLIEEDKQFEAEVVKQVLASTAPGSLDGIVSLPPTVETLVHPSILHAASSEPHPPVLSEHSHLLSSMPMACSTPSRSSIAAAAPVAASVAQMRTESKVVRGNGRVIYLPPIEAPTTRAKRRAQFTPTTGDMNLSSVSIGEPTLDSSSLSNESQAPHKPGPVPKRANPREPSLARRSTEPRRTKKLNASQSNDTEASESQEDDDDPNKLWCICRQPHNNRFMICCDLCEDWFHGTCVGVTKSMGIEMEQKSVIWKCPKCVKKQEEKNQPRITEMLVMRPALQTEETSSETKVLTSSAESVASPQPNRTLPMGVPVASVPLRSSVTKRLPTNQQVPGKMMLQQQQLNFVKVGAPSGRTPDNNCVVCRRPSASTKSVYCSDECIRKYAQNAIQAQTAAKGPDNPVPQTAMDTQSAQLNLANCTEAAKRHKKKDLFEDVLRQADTVSKIERINVIERKSGRVITGHLAPMAHHFRKWLLDNPTFEVLPSGSFQSLDTEKRPFNRIPDPASTHDASAAAAKPTTSATKVSQQLRVVTPPTHALPKKDNKPLANVVDPRSPSKPEPIRLNVRRTLKEQLLARIKEAQDAEQRMSSSSSAATHWLTSIEAEQFVKDVESEMYHSFGCDVGAKYKSKYRSLMFNIKDRKNKTLLEKICAKQVEPKQLVAMTPEELASQELAKWREEETRHQLEIIKKSELDMLSCTQNYVVKTHKGEEVITTKVDVTLPDESILDKKHTSQMSDPDPESSSKDISLEQSSSRESQGKSGSSKEKRHKSRKRHHQHKRSRSRSSSQTRSLEKRHRRHHNDVETGGERTHRQHEKQRSKDRDERIPSPAKKREENDRTSLPKNVTEKKPDDASVSVSGKSNRHAYNLVDKILESEKTVEQAASLEQPLKQTAKATAPVAAPASPLDSYTRYLQGLPKRTLWSGTLNMNDVANFQVAAHPLLSNALQLTKLLPVKLDVIGRITRDNVWEYIKKINKIPTKKVVLVNLFPSGTTEIKKFDHFFEYLDSRQRLGVIEGDADKIRDFYIFPLGSRDKLPSVLAHVTELVPFYEDKQRPNTLIGIIVHCLPTSLPVGQSFSSASSSSSSTKVSKKPRSMTSFTPPSSPKRKPSNHSTSSKDDEFDIDAIIKAPIAKMRKTTTLPTVPTPVVPAVIDDADEPYSPGGSSDDESVTTTPTSIDKTSLARQVAEINKQIAAQQLEIADLLNVEPSGSANALSRISIPPDLSRILASIKDKSDFVANVGDSEEYNPEDAITTPRPYASATTKSKGRLAHLSEAELLSMVPDNLVDMVPRTTSKIRLQNPSPPNT